MIQWLLLESADLRFTNFTECEFRPIQIAGIDGDQLMSIKLTAFQVTTLRVGQLPHIFDRMIVQNKVPAFQIELSKSQRMWIASFVSDSELPTIHVGIIRKIERTFYKSVYLVEIVFEFSRIGYFTIPFKMVLNDPQNL